MSLRDVCCIDGVKKEISPRLQQILFSAGLRYNGTQQLNRVTHSDQISYVGEPSEDIDTAWHQLIGGKGRFSDYLLSVLKFMYCSNQRVCDTCRKSAVQE
jgi:hypothetical protein